MTFHHNTFKNNHDYDHTRNETKFNAKGPTTSHNVPLSFLCYYTIVFKIRYLIGQLGNGGKSKGGWGQALPPSPIWLMLRVVTDKTDKMKQGKFFSALRSSERILSLVFLWYKATNFRGIVGDCRLAAPTDFIGGILVTLSRLTGRIQSLVFLWYKATNFRGIVGDCRLAATTDFIRGISTE